MWPLLYLPQVWWKTLCGWKRSEPIGLQPQIFKAIKATKSERMHLLQPALTEVKMYQFVKAAEGLIANGWDRIWPLKKKRNMSVNEKTLELFRYVQKIIFKFQKSILMNQFMKVLEVLFTQRWDRIWPLKDKTNMLKVNRFEKYSRLSRPRNAKECIAPARIDWGHDRVHHRSHTIQTPWI